MQKTILTAIGLLLVSLIANADEHPDFAQDGRPFIQKFCIGCHGGAEPKAELSFDTFNDSPSLVRQRKVWENAVKMVTGGEMPPKDEPRP
ncbi:MAG: c-type cytochrome domain-containing protein, partial [Planctomycetota bacterium]